MRHGKRPEISDKDYDLWIYGDELMLTIYTKGQDDKTRKGTLAELADFFPNPLNLTGRLGFELIICPNCRTVCESPSRSELGGSDVRGYYCSTSCKAAYIG